MHTPLQAPLRSEKQCDSAQRTSAGAVAQKRGLVDNRPEAVKQRKLAEMMNNSPRVPQQQAPGGAIHNSPHMLAQRHKMNARFGETVQLQEGDAIPAQLSALQREEKPNNTGLPNQLKSGIEFLSGMSMDHVKVHYNSDKPAQLQAHAYAQGSEIHVGPGQERHVPHEAWHVVQQAQGRVRPNLQLKGIAINDDAGMETEANLMGARANLQGHGMDASARFAERRCHNRAATIALEGEVIQRNVGFNVGALAAPFFRGTNMGAAVRPNWVGHWAGAGAMAGIGAGNSRNHIVAYHHIAEALVNISNAIYVGMAGGVAVPAAVATLAGVSNALYPNAAGAEYAAMIANRAALVAAITNVVNYLAPTAIEEQALAQAATVLEGDLMSAPQNVRAANANMNLRIGNNIDAEYHLTLLPIAPLPGALFLHGNVMPAPWLAGAVGGGVGAQWGNVGLGGAPLAIGANFYVMDPLHNQIVDRFTQHGAVHLGADVTVVRNDDPANMVPGYTPNAPLSSTADPIGAGYAVILFDPTGVNLPIRFA